MQLIPLVITVPPHLSNIHESVEEMVIHTNQLVTLAQGLCLEAPEGEFKQSAAQILDTLHYLKACIDGLDPLTEGAKDVNMSDFMSDPHTQAKRKR